MMVDAMAMTTPAASLTGLYAALALLLLSLQLKSAWSWRVKAAVIALALPAVIGVYLAIQAQLGWPSDTGLPAHFQLHAAVVDEPAAKDAEGGAIFLWLTPWADPEAEEANAPDHRPRAFALPYSRALHQQVHAMQERLARGELVVGRHRQGQGWQRRFGEQNGEVDLEAPPPPPLPAKEG
ncbi:MAG: hypothetical protein R3F54_04905 [Alphaproteobacteria bacterium]